MNGRSWAVILLVLTPVFAGAWKTSQEERRAAQELRKGLRYHNKRHMLLTESSEPKRRPTTPRSREMKKKPSGHLTPLHEDDIDNDEVVSVAIGPPPIRPKYEKLNWKHVPKPTPAAVQNNTNTQGATDIVKNLLTQLGREFLTHQVNEDFVFGQYIGNAMRNLTSEHRLKMQHEVLDLVVKYQRLNRGEPIKFEEKTNPSVTAFKDSREPRTEKRFSLSNDTEEGWPDFSNLAKIVG